jgi:transcriptional regulator of acetoin/glycerol metabolism
MTPATLVKRIHQLNTAMLENRSTLADQRAEYIRELMDKVGGTEAARLLGVSRAAIYKAARRER